MEAGPGRQEDVAESFLDAYHTELRKALDNTD
jgi:hypothetical protein